MRDYKKENKNLSYAQEILDKIEEIKNKNKKFIVITGGVCSSIGKGVLVSSLGVLLKKAGYSVSVVKWDPYLNVDPGTMSPLEHGEVFVTCDGAETDLDIGHYERLIGIHATAKSSVSSGQIYKEILQGERGGNFLGRCIQIVPHLVDATKRRLLAFACESSAEFILLEIGGTVGDIEGNIFLESIRQLRATLGSKYIFHGHLSYVPVLSWTGEVKTKPTQHSVISLTKAGLVPDCLFLRSDSQIDIKIREKLSIMCGINKDFIFNVLTCNPVYKLFLELDKQGVASKLQEYFKVSKIKNSDLGEWESFIRLIHASRKTISIGLVAKYVGSNDPYISVIDALRSAGYYHKYQVNIIVIDSEKLEKQSYGNGGDAWQALTKVDGIVVPGGFDQRGIAGKILAAKWARENKVPYFGLCLGMQVMLIEAARSLLNFSDANSTEFCSKTKHPVISLLEEQKGIKQKGGTMRLGSFPCKLVAGTKAYNFYKKYIKNKNIILERHRHRYEVNNFYKKDFEKVGIVFSGIYQEKDLVEISEYKNHPFMLGVQFHPEFSSSPLNIHPLFKEFITAVIKCKTK
jgi:CTP synthase